MKGLRLKTPRPQLDAEAYRDLHRQILERDGWRCQGCGSMRNLQVHHKEFRSRSGDDTEINLITLCAMCHQQVHRSIRCGRGEEPGEDNPKN